MVSLIPIPLRAPPGLHLDKAMHLWEYLVFAWLLMQVVHSSGAAASNYQGLMWIFATSYGMLMELLQALVPWRRADWWDIAFNAIGAALGVWIGRRWIVASPSR